MPVRGFRRAFPFGQLFGGELPGGGRRGPERLGLVPQPATADAPAHLLARAVRSDAFAHLDDRDLAPDAHVAQVVHVQVEQPGLAGQHGGLRRRQRQARNRLVVGRLLAGRHHDLVPGAAQVRGVQLHRVGAVLLGIGQGDGALIAQVLDVEGLARGQVDDAFGQLRRTALHIRAADVLVALLGRGESGPAGGAALRHDEFAQPILAPFAAFQHRSDQFGDHVAGLAHDDRVPDEHALAFDLEGVVQGGAGHGGAGHMHGFQDGDRRDAAGAADLHGDVEQFGVDLLRRVFVGDRPARGARGGPQRALQRQVVDLDHDAVERVFDVAAVFAVVVDHLQDLVEGGDGAVVRGDGDAPLAVQVVGLRLVGDLVVRAGGASGTPVESADAVRVEAQATRGGDARVLLPQRSGRGVPRIGERRTPRVRVLIVQGPEVVPPHEHLAADLHEVGDIRGLAAQGLRDRGDGAHVQRDVLAGHTVAAGQSLFEHAAAVDEVQRQAVDLDLAAHRQRPALGPVQVAAHAVVPVTQLLDREHVVQAHHARGVPDRGELVRECAPDAVRGRLRRIQRGERLLQRLQAAHARIVGGVGGHRRIVDVVGDLVGLHPRGHLGPQPGRIVHVQCGRIQRGQPHRVRVVRLQRADPGRRPGGERCGAGRHLRFDRRLLRAVDNVEIPRQLFGFRAGRRPAHRCSPRLDCSILIRF